MEVESCVPPGFRFHPTEEELVGYYLTRKVASQKIDLEVIRDIDLYRIEPWDLKDRCRHGYEEQTEWYFFSHKDKKYPSGTRTNRATAAGFWKATGRDKSVLSKNKLIGMRKTLVFYQGRAPNGRKTDWIMHEYRLQSTEHGPTQEEGWVVCRAFRKQVTSTQRPYSNMFNPTYYIRDQEQFGLDQGLQDASPSTQFFDSCSGVNFQGQPLMGLVNEIEPRQSYLNHIFDIPQLDSPSLSTSVTNKDCLDPSFIANEDCGRQRNDCGGQFIDWKVLDKLLAGQSSESASCSNSNVLMIPPNSSTDHVQSGEDHYLASFHS